MDIKFGLLIVFVGYSIIYFFDSFFKSCAHYPYIKFLDGTGLKIKFFNIHWTTTAFNRSLLRLGSLRSNTKFLNYWFTTGLIFSLILLPIAVILLIFSFAQNFVPSPNNQIVLSPIIPGVNLPASELVFYSATLIICSVVHEFGHALAAVKEDVQVISLGVNVFFILPVAYVNLNTENLRNVEPWKRMKILAAGVWHNLVLSLFCYLMYLSLPALLSSVFYVGEGVSVYEATNTSPLIGVKGLELGDEITRINDCRITNEDTWTSCLNRISRKNGVCFDPDVVREYDETSTSKHLANGYVECCDESKKGNVCFEFLDNENGILELPPHVCLPVRKMLDKSGHYCSRNDRQCPQNNHCFVPLLNDTRLFKITIANKRTVIYMGLAEDFLRTLKVSSFIPRYFFKTPTFAEVLKKMLEYIVIISLGLGMINIMPCFFMDGQHIMNTLLYIFLSKSFSSDKVILVSSMVCLVFTTLLIAHCVLAIIPFVF